MLIKLLMSLLILIPASPPQDHCPGETNVQPGRWLVTSTRQGEAPARGRSEILWLDGACVLLERIVLHFDDGSSHHIVFVQGWDEGGEEGRLVQVGDHPLFLIWERERTGAEMYRTTRPTPGGVIELQWYVEQTGEGFRRELRVRRTGDTEWSSSEVMVYAPLLEVEQIDRLPSLTPGPFHDSVACEAPGFRDMDHLLGHWMKEEWIRTEGGDWTPASVSVGTVHPLIGGCALMERHPIFEDGRLTDRSLLLRGYDPRADRWSQIVFGQHGGVWEWEIEAREGSWLLTPSAGPMEGRLRIFERPRGGGITKRIEILGPEGWETRRRVEYVPW